MVGRRQIKLKKTVESFKCQVYKGSESLLLSFAKNYSNVFIDNFVSLCLIIVKVKGEIIMIIYFTVYQKICLFFNLELLGIV